jgi:murein DD-endopeptidase MepM/ murein hydrolase activator NlpD
MFEYLMPLLFTRTYPHTLLEEVRREAVELQVDYGRQQNIPWGISESAYAAVDANQIYQYQAFGVPGLGLKRGLAEDLVVAPYASGLALMVEPEAALVNLKRLLRLGLRGDYGYYESIDFTAERQLRGQRGVIVHAGWWGAYGNAVIIDHGGGVTTLYGHMSAVRCSAGQSVKRGSVIGLVGSTGWSTGPHCHFEVRRNGVPVNPFGAR